LCYIYNYENLFNPYRFSTFDSTYRIISIAQNFSIDSSHPLGNDGTRKLALRFAYRRTRKLAHKLFRKLARKLFRKLARKLFRKLARKLFRKLARKLTRKLARKLAESP
jgi:hypothetical protein